MKKIISIALVLVLSLAVMTACSVETTSTKTNIDVNTTDVGTTGAVAGTFTNNGDEDISATVTVVWYDEEDNELGTTVTEIPYIMAGDSVFEVFEFDKEYDDYDCDVETGEPAEGGYDFYSNLTLEGEANDDGSLAYNAGVEGEPIDAELIVLYKNDDDKIIDFDREIAKGEGVVSGIVDGCEIEGVSSYVMNIIPKNMK